MTRFTYGSALNTQHSAATPSRTRRRFRVRPFTPLAPISNAAATRACQPAGIWRGFAFAPRALMLCRALEARR